MTHFKISVHVKKQQNLKTITVLFLMGRVQFHLLLQAYF